jgi:4-carboxymuconolactone decarboxylase
MARIAGIFRADASEDVRRVYDWAEHTFGKPLEPLMVFAHHPELFRTYVGFEQGLETACRLPARVRELVQLKAAARIGCPFCLDIGSALARRAGLDETTLRGLVDHAASDAFSPAEKLALDYTVAMTATPVVVPDALVAALADHFDAAALVELTTVIAWENFRSRFNHALGIGAAGFSEDAYCVRPEIDAP